MKRFFIYLIFILIQLPVLANDSIILPSQVGIIENINYVDLDTNSIVQTKQVADVKILTGDFKNKIITIDNVLTGNPYYDIQLKKGTKVILHVEVMNGDYDISIENIKRSSILNWLSLLFCGLLIFIGKRKGVFSLISIGITVLLITNFLAPMILAKINPIVATFIIALLSTAITMFSVGGINAKSSSATLGALASIIFAGILSFITINIAHLTGFTDENSMFLYNTHPELNFIAITISTIILATLGAVMDIAMSISSTINEINDTNPQKTSKELFISGMNVGKDIIGTMANTLILVYLGGALPLILLAENIDWQKFINLNQVVTEISSALIGSIAIVICVPFTAFIASKLIKFTQNNSKKETFIDCN